MTIEAMWLLTITLVSVLILHNKFSLLYIMGPSSIKGVSIFGQTPKQVEFLASAIG